MLEVYTLFVFHGATPRGFSAEPFHFDPDSGAMKFRGRICPICWPVCSGCSRRDHEVEVLLNGIRRKLTYGRGDRRLAADITVSPQGGTVGPTPVFNLSDRAEFERLKKEIADAWKAAGLPLLLRPVPVRMTRTMRRRMTTRSSRLLRCISPR